MKLLRKKIGALKGLALAGILGTMSAGQHAQAVFVFSILDSDTFTITASGSSLTGSLDYRWGSLTGSLSQTFNVSTTPGGTVGTPLPVSRLYYDGGNTITGLRLYTPDFGGYNLPDGGVYTVSGNTIDLTTLVLPAAPLAMTSGIINTTGANNDLIQPLQPTPEPSSAILIAVGGCTLLLRRKRA